MVSKIKKSSLLRMYKFLGRRSFPYMMGIMVMATTSFAFNIIVSIGLKGITEAITDKNMQILINSMIFMSLATLAMMIIMPFFNYLIDSNVKKTIGELRKRLFRHIQGLPMKNLEANHSGDFISRLTNDIQATENAYGNQLLMVFMALISGIGSIITIAIVDWRFLLFALGVGIISVYVNSSFIKPLKTFSTKIQELLSELNQKLIDTLGGIQVIRVFNLEQVFSKKYEDSCRDVKKWSMKKVVKNSYLNSLNNFIGVLGFVGIIIMGSITVINDSISFAKLMVIIQMMNGIMFMFNSIGNFITQLQDSIAGAERVFFILDMPLEAEEASISIKKADTLEKEVVSFEKVEFSYEEDKRILQGINVKLNKDEVVALVGSSGSGKSTIFKLLLGFQKHCSGNIKIYGRDISEYSPNKLRKLIAYVPQENYLFSGTIGDNIGYGKEGASIEEIMEAAKAAYAHDFIMELTEGYNTEVGERGAHLSGGQRQRIAIARALLKDAPILLLDEATSALDSESEREVQKALEVLMKGRSTMVIAHRLSTIQNADKIYVLEEGKVLEEGLHEELVEKDSVYAKLYNLQISTPA
jgi:ATP-binding cassette subfamily B protein